jgi:hypothetical protein
VSLRVVAAERSAAAVVTDVEDVDAISAPGAAPIGDAELGAVGAGELHAARPMLKIANPMNGRASRVTQKAMVLLLWSRMTRGRGCGARWTSILT